jgi:hypothetical protein
MKALAVAVLATLTGCATDLGNQRHAQHGADQVRMIAIQREARAQEKEAQAEANEKLFEALARVAESNPDHAPSVAVALAVIGVRGASDNGGDAPTVTLQQQKNEALEWTKALVPTVGGLVTGLGVAAINAEVQKNASDNNRDILLGDQAADRGIVEAVAGLGTAAANSVGTEVAGDFYQMSDSASVDNSTVTTTSEDTTTTNTTSTTVSLNTTLNYEGSEVTLSDLISSLNAAGASYSIDLNNDGIPEVSGGTDTADVSTGVSCVPTFDGYQCSGS